jgi:hypothetical protein|tara:strand:+ start:50 stop:241 length:192 start_codon:yes stop_codon:yes gene_type:complete
MENNKKTLNLSEAIKLQTGLIQLALVTDRQDLLNIATDRLEKLINLIPQDIDSNGEKFLEVAQ